MPHAQPRQVHLLPGALPGATLPLQGERDAVSFRTDNPARDRIDPAPAGTSAVWAGWLADDANPAKGRFPLDFRLWTRTAWEALAAGLAAIAPALEARRATLWLRPAAGCILADPQACLTFLRSRPSPAIGLLLDPVAMLTPDMLGDLDDHLVRAMSIAGFVDGVEAVVLAAPVHAPDGSVGHGPLADHPRLASIVIDAWAAFPVGHLPVIVVDRRDAALLAPPP